MRVSNLSSLTGLVKVVIYLAFIGALLASFFRLFVKVALFLIGTVQMANMFEDVSRGKPFAWYRYIKSVLNPGLLFGGLVVIVISEVFRLGNKLQEEQELTV